MMSKNFARCYALLGAFPDDSWETLRTKYRRQIQQWHPDRFADKRGQVLASEKAKELNTAFETLNSFFAQHGHLPSVSTPDTGDTSAVSPPATCSDSSESADHPAATPENQSEDSKKAPPRYRRLHIATAAGLFAFSAFYLLEFTMMSQDLVESTEGNIDSYLSQYGRTRIGTGQFSTAAVEQEDVNKQSLGNTTDDKKHYLAKRTPSDPATTDALAPFPTAITPQYEHAYTNTTFRKGSPKKEVLAAQGSPDKESEAIWEYGPSRVYFHHGHVIAWDEHPDRPLNLSR